LRDRIAHEITTTFASAYTSEISLAEALDPGGDPSLPPRGDR
jgi:hypothetical protein